MQNSCARPSSWKRVTARKGITAAAATAHADTKEKEPDKKPAPTTAGTPPPAATPRDTTKDQARMLLLLTTDWLNNDRTHSLEIAAALAEVVAVAGPPGCRGCPVRFAK